MHPDGSPHATPVWFVCLQTVSGSVRMEVQGPPYREVFADLPRVLMVLNR
ncbi:hypothetical protein ACFVW8_26445 [Streptomyces sp. NPDC058221]